MASETEKNEKTSAQTCCGSVVLFAGEVGISERPNRKGVRYFMQPRGFWVLDVFSLYTFT